MALTNGVQYTYTIFVSDSSGNTTTKYQTVIPAINVQPPVGVPVVVGGDATLTISWAKVTIGGITIGSNPAVSHYRVYYGTAPGNLTSDKDNVVPADLNAPSLVLVAGDGIVNNTTYWVAVAAVYDTAESVKGTEASGVAAPPSGVGQPTNVEAFAGNASAKITWDVVPNATSYKVYFTAADGVPGNYDNANSPKIVATNEVIIDAPALQNDAMYFFAVQAYAGTTPGDMSEEVSAMPDATLTGFVSGYFSTILRNGFKLIAPVFNTTENVNPYFKSVLSPDPTTIFWWNGTKFYGGTASAGPGQTTPVSGASSYYINSPATVLKVRGDAWRNNV